MLRNPFRSGPADTFVRELASSMLDELGEAARKREPKFREKAQRVLRKAEGRVSEFKKAHSLNWFQKSRAANAFLWTLKERQCDEAYARELTQWLVSLL